ncbi:MAG: hypothetical protein PHH06_00035 [Candidatus Gracilibacteria bacterium]|nr:hypothetical protein [Candidatus Gracilibacteria bacterium]
MSQTIYSWSFSSKKSRGNTWYIITLSIVIGLVIWGFLTKQYGMSFIILLLSGLIYFVENNTSDLVEVSINELGIKIGDSFYDFSVIDSFTLLYEGENAILVRLNLNKKGLRHLDLNIDNNIALDLKNILTNYIVENGKENLGFVDKVIRLLKL